MNYEFLHPWLLLLLGIIPALIFWYNKNRKTRFAQLSLSGFDGAQAHLRTWKTFLKKWLHVLRWITLALFIIALARPQKVLDEETIKAEGIDIMLAMDLSSSMLAQDFKPDRLKASKEVARNFVSNRKYDRVGLVAFAGEAFTQCPLTIDHHILNNFIDNLECGFLNDGTAIGMGLATAVNRLKDSKAESKIVILLTDGENNAGYIMPSTASTMAKDLGIKVYTIGVGTTGDALAPVQKRSDGKYIFGLVQVRIDEVLLKEIAETTNGQYFRATDRESLEEIYATIDQLEKTEVDVQTFRKYNEAFHPFLLIGLLLLLLEIILKYTVLRTIP